MAGTSFIHYCCGLISIILYYFISYQTQRYETLPLMICYGVLFLLYVSVVLRSGNDKIRLWLSTAVLIRIMLIFSMPNLSDDFYRFIWDGRLLSSGYHPFAKIPEYYIDNQINVNGIDASLFSKLNSKTYFTVYPPLAQSIFWIAVKCSPGSLYGSMIIMKVILVLAELGTMIMMIALLKKFNLPRERILLYALNPLVILELSANVHLEAVMIFFIVLSLWLLISNQLILSGITFALVVSTKLIPLIFLPVLLVHLGWRKSLKFYLTVLGITLILFLPLLDQDIIRGFQHSIGYYFQKFEFNASIYYVVRQAGYWIFGYNIIQAAGWVLGALSALLILYYSLYWVPIYQLGFTKTKRLSIFRDGISDHSNLPFHWMWILVLYFLLVTTLHPWYITTLLALSIFTPYRFVLLWTALIFLTYTGYTENGFQENLWITFLEYFIVSGYLLYELYERRGKEKSFDHLLPES